MSRSGRTRSLLAALVAVPLLFIAIAALQTQIDASTPSDVERSDQLIVTSAPVVKKVSFGYDALLADIYWTRAVQYYGTRVGDANADFPQLWPLLDIATTLDPKLVVAYRFGAIFLSEPRPVGAGQTNRATELIRRGIAANPDEWHLGTDLGFLYYWRLKDYPDAAAAYLQTSQNPKAPPWIKLLAARISEHGNSADVSRAIWTDIYNSSTDSSIRNMATEQLRGIQAQEDESKLDALAEQYRQRFGRFPASSAELRAAGLLVGIPVDPAGVPYIFGPDGKSKLDPASSVPVEKPLPSASAN